MNTTLSTRQVGGITILDIDGRIVLGEESASVRNVIRNLLNNGHKQILFNLGDVEYVDTIGLGSLVGAFTTVRNRVETQNFSTSQRSSLAQCKLQNYIQCSMS